MNLTEAQRKTIATLESMSNEAADQWVGEPENFPRGRPLGVVQSVQVEICTGWATHEVMIHPDGSLEHLD